MRTFAVVVRWTEKDACAAFAAGRTGFRFFLSDVGASWKPKGFAERVAKTRIFTVVKDLIGRKPFFSGFFATGKMSGFPFCKGKREHNSRWGAHRKKPASAAKAKAGVGMPDGQLED